MNRRKVREHAFLMLFSIPFHDKEEWEEQIARYKELHGDIEGEDPSALSEDDFAEVAAKVRGVLSHLAEIDALLDVISEGWKVARMNKVDLSVLRLAAFEQQYDGVPKGVAINEAVELAKAYGENRSGSFVNGVLAKLPEGKPAHESNASDEEGV